MELLEDYQKILQVILFFSLVPVFGTSDRGAREHMVGL